MRIRGINDDAGVFPGGRSSVAMREDGTTWTPKAAFGALAPAYAVPAAH